MSILQTVIASISKTSAGGGGGGGGGGGSTFKSWTIEWWEKKLSPQVSGTARVFACGVDTSASIGYSNESGGDYIWTGGTGTGPLTVGSIANSWHHFSINSDGTNLYYFKDGVSLSNVARAGNKITDTTTAFLLGGDTSSHWKGRITDFHIVKGVCKYNTNYSVPGRLTATGNTVLLMQFAPSSLNSTSGPNADQVSNATWNADDPWTDGNGSVTFTGATNSFMSWNGNSIFALDV
jgi:hypothetical protein